MVGGTRLAKFALPHDGEAEVTCKCFHITSFRSPPVAAEGGGGGGGGLLTKQRVLYNAAPRLLMYDIH